MSNSQKSFIQTTQQLQLFVLRFTVSVLVSMSVLVSAVVVVVSDAAVATMVLAAAVAALVCHGASGHNS